MNSKLPQTWAIPPIKIRFLLIILLVLGVYLRFANLDRKVYAYDETFTGLRVSGYTTTEFVQQTFNGHVIGSEDLQKYQRPNAEKGVIDTIKGLAIEEPQLPPPYFLLTRFWMQWFGSSEAVMRSVPALISLLAFPCIYWLCLELFGSPLVGWIAIALVAVSPFHVLFAQEARPYSLWTVTILLSSASLLQAMRLKTKLSWGMYAVTVALGIYSHLFFGLVAIGHGIYVFVTEGFKLSSRFVAYLFASFAGILTFVPWLLVILANLSQSQSTTDWTGKDLPLLSLVKMWAVNLSQVYLDLNIGLGYYGPLGLGKYGSLLYLLIVTVLILIGYSIYFLFRNSPRKASLFILTLIGVTGLSLVLPDLILGSRRSSVSRYLIPCHLGIQLAVAYLFATQITHIYSKQRQKLWRVIMVALFSTGILSCVILSQAEIWWNKGPFKTMYNPQIAHAINATSYPLVISDTGIKDTSKYMYVLAFSHLTDPKVQFQLTINPNVPKIPDSFSNVFLYKPSTALQSGIEKNQGYKLEPDKLGDDWLLRLAK